MIENKRVNLWAILISLMICVLIALDMVGDYREGVHWQHLLLELGILSLSLSGIVYFWRLYCLSAQAKIALLRHDLELANRQARHWRDANRDLIVGLAKQIQQQFDSWQLTRAEAEVGMFMLKGLSHAQIAELRHSSERTIRDQARAIYRKAGVNNRIELSAFFLEDLLMPNGPQSEADEN
ncbi:helix-turn-helix transcriptional regulator [Methylomonas sp. HYX-M1]|uniref:helix-turn-helix transcriptional regulator n=1 Tax=Methylomonas sp. HYX-M1 TaxID=3139307 RepID=UPI00345BCF92